MIVYLNDIFLSKDIENSDAYFLLWKKYAHFALNVREICTGILKRVTFANLLMATNPEAAIESIHATGCNSKNKLKIYAFQKNGNYLNIQSKNTADIKSKKIRYIHCSRSLVITIAMLIILYGVLITVGVDAFIGWYFLHK